jgi:hypothetical protein
MKRIVAATAISLMLVTGTSLFAQRNPEYSTVIVRYMGKSDRPFPTTIISTSTKEAEWYRNELCGDPESLFTQITILRKTTMRKLGNVLQEDSVRNRFFSADKPKTEPALDIVFGLGRKHSEVAISANDSIMILTELKKCVPNYRSLMEQLSTVQDQMNRFVKNHDDH